MVKRNGEFDFALAIPCFMTPRHLEPAHHRGPTKLTYFGGR